MPVLTVPATSNVAEYPRVIPRPVSRAAYQTISFAGLTSLAFLIHGYHPYSQDAAIYIAGVEKEMNPSLFSVDAPFVEGHARLSIFSHVLAAPAQFLHIPLDALLLIAYIASVVLFLVACHRLAIRLFHSQWEQWGGVLLPAACFTIPVAGTSLLLMDPYVTARSFSTPLSILAVASCLDRSWKWMTAWTVLTIALHPLMGVYLIYFLAVLCLVEMQREALAVRLCVAGFLLCGVIAWISQYFAISPDYRQVVATHGYLFLSAWHWYEIAGLIAPVILMGIVATRCELESAMGKLAAACMLTGITSYLSALCFVHSGHPDILARLQLLRSFHMIYCAGAIMLGGFLISWFWTRGIWVACGAFAIAAFGMAISEAQSYPESSRIELPGRTMSSPWEQAFLWIRNNTPANAVFAADSTALTIRDEDAQGFRVIAERSILNGAKDEGVTSIFPGLAPLWVKYRDAEWELDEASDAERVERLHPLGVTWVLLSPRANSQFSCPYRNGVVSVCQLGVRTHTREIAQ